MSREVFYPPIGIAHITNDITDLVKYKLNNQSKIIINTSAQPNSSPHLGTITTIMCSFALAKHLKEMLKKRAINSIRGILSWLFLILCPFLLITFLAVFFYKLYKSSGIDPSSQMISSQFIYVCT